MRRRTASTPGVLTLLLFGRGPTDNVLSLGKRKDRNYGFHGVPGKTGTAEASKSQQTHAGFIGFAPAEAPTVAVAVILENAGVGGEEAAPAARQVLQAALTAGSRAR